MVNSTLDALAVAAIEIVNEQFDQPVGDHAEAVGPVLHPDTAISQVVVHLTESRNNLPVVEEDTGKLLGMVSYWDIVGRILGGE